MEEYVIAIKETEYQNFKKMLGKENDYFTQQELEEFKEDFFNNTLKNFLNYRIVSNE